ncbi:transglycosylase family protein [Streptomyces sp. NPDC046805]|uniref:transglycosylase family protein n=1 Tax=Streptomyces sp. NPDC046805 TaxID=3155134 RepID=UPI0033ECCE48
MISGNGRHRRPRQAPAVLVAAGVTGSALALPLLGAASANAADGTTWDRVAECESGGSWSASTGNGYYGGLQISQEDWDKYGGGHYASSPDEASRSQQIAVAEKMLADQGTGHWATCALLAGLSSKSGSVHVDTGVSGGGSSHSGSGSSGGHGSSGLIGALTSGGSSSGSSSEGSSSASSASPSTDADAGAGAESGSTGSGGPVETGKSAPAGSSGAWNDGSSHTASPEADDSDNEWQSGSSWSLVDTGAIGGGGRHRGDSADENGANRASGDSADSSARHAYTVQAGDTLASIADSLDVDGGWRALYGANKKAVGSDPNRIAAGQTLHIGGEKGAK